MDAEHLAKLKSEIFSRVRAILYERYGEFIPASLLEGEADGERGLKTIHRVGSFKADEDLIELFEALQKVLSGNYGFCLLCRKEIAFDKLDRNPLSKFCDACERLLSPGYPEGDAKLGEG